jgi:hypothetical protein
MLVQKVKIKKNNKGCPRNVNVVNKLLGYAKINSSP